MAAEGWQQRGLVAVTIRGSVLFSCSMNARFSFCRPVLVSIRSRFNQSKNLILPLKNVPWSFLTMKKYKNKVESRRYHFLLIFKSYFSHKTEGFIWSQKAWMLMIAVSSKWLYDPYDVRSKILHHEVITSCTKHQLSRASSHIWKSLLYRNRLNDIQRGLQRLLCLPNSLQHYFTSKCDFFINIVKFKVGFYSLETEYRLAWTPYNCAILSEQIGWLPIRCAYFILFYSQMLSEN